MAELAQLTTYLDGTNTIMVEEGRLGRIRLVEVGLVAAVLVVGITSLLPLQWTGGGGGGKSLEHQPTGSR